MTPTAPTVPVATIAPTPPHELSAGPDWTIVDIVSDLHLQAGEPATVQAWRDYLATSSANALFILGDLFEAWVGDDGADAPGLEAESAAALGQAAHRMDIHFMHGNRDFLLGRTFAERAGISLLPDPTVLVLQEQRWFLTHGDALCLEDIDYQRLRAQVRNPDFQRALLARPLAERRVIAQDARQRSEAHQTSGPAKVWAEVDAEAARAWLLAAGAETMIHGHTHRPSEHRLGDKLSRIVLSDWDALARPPRAQVLRIAAGRAQRVNLL